MPRAEVDTPESVKVRPLPNCAALGSALASVGALGPRRGVGMLGILGVDLPPIDVLLCIGVIVL